EKVLDAACGTGYGSAMLATEGRAARVIGLDISREAIVEASGKYGQIPNLEFMLGSVEDLPFPDDSFDLYTSFETIEHVPNPRKLLAEAVRVLKPGGILLISTPNRTLTNPGKTLGDRPFNRFHLREWSMAEFANLLREFFTDVQMFTQAPFSLRYARLLGRVGRLSHWLGFRLHQVCKVFLELSGRFPDCSVQPLQPATVGEVCFAVCRGGLKY
ncbi:MAG: class I SAM-dependent methyltransferase, partial [Candidatus Hadarchaeum sp.]